MNYLTRKYFYYYNQIKPFGFVMFVNYPLFHVLFHIADTLEYQNLFLRLFLSSLCIPLILIDRWSQKYPVLSILYWHMTVILCLPFFFTYMTLMNQVSTLWLMNDIAVIFFMLLILDIVLFSIDLVIGAALGLFVFYMSGHDFIITPGVIDILSLTATFFAVVIIGSVFSHNRPLTEQERLKNLKSIGNIDHSFQNL